VLSDLLARHYYDYHGAGRDMGLDTRLVSSGTGGAGLLGSVVFLAMTSWLGLSVVLTLHVLSVSQHTITTQSDTSAHGWPHSYYR
jgi:hypothetical protein